MGETIDPYFADRLENAKKHKVLGAFEIPERKMKEVEPNKELTNPTIEGDLEDFGWSEKSVDNLIDAAEKGHIRIVSFEEDDLVVELMPIPAKDLPAELGHVCELPVVQKNVYTDDKSVFGPAEERDLTYLQTTAFAVEGYMDDEQEGKNYARVFVDTEKLDTSRNIYLDPESLNVTDYEYGHAFSVFGGIPYIAISRVDVIKAKRFSPVDFADMSGSDFPGVEEVEAEYKKQVARLKEYLSR